MKKKFKNIRVKFVRILCKIMINNDMYGIMSLEIILSKYYLKF